MESEVILTTERLRLRKLTPDDLPLLEKSLCDARVMYAYEHGFSRDEALEWLERQLSRYSSDGCGLWASNACPTAHSSDNAASRCSRFTTLSSRR